MTKRKELPIRADFSVMNGNNVFAVPRLAIASGVKENFKNDAVRERKKFPIRFFWVWREHSALFLLKNDIFCLLESENLLEKCHI